jgi:hypothetical protein
MFSNRNSKAPMGFFEKIGAFVQETVIGQQQALMKL